MTATAQKIENVRAQVMAICERVLNGESVSQAEIDHAIAIAGILPDRDRVYRLLRGEAEPKADNVVRIAMRRPVIDRSARERVEDEKRREELRAASARAKEAQEKPKAKLEQELITQKEVALPLLKELADVFRNDDSAERLRYNTQKAEVAKVLGVQQMDVQRAVMKLIDDEKKEKAKERIPQTQKLIALATRADMKHWIDPQDDTPYVSIFVGTNVAGHWEHYRVGSKECDRWLRAEYGRRYKHEVDGRLVSQALSNQSLAEATATVEAHCWSEGSRSTPFLRIGGSPNEVWLDLGGQDWTLIKVTADGWEPFRTGWPGIAFIRKKGMLDLPEPVRCENIKELRQFMNVSDEDFVLQVGVLVGWYRPKGPYVINIITGVPGAAKTTHCRAMQCLIDPNGADLLPFGKTEDDIYVAGYNRYLLPFDNIVKVSPEQANVLCRISTGIGYAKRQLRTDADQFMMHICRPQLLNGWPEDLADRGDLADRAVVCNLPRLDEDSRLSDDDFWEAFKEARPRILGALLHGVSGAIAGAKGIELKGYGHIRMPDFARWAEAACRKLGFGEGAFLSAFAGNQERAMRIAFKRDTVAQAVALLIEQNPEGWRGNALPLLKALEKVVNKAMRFDLLEDKYWPKNNVWLGRRLRAAVPVLVKVADITVDFDVNCREGEISYEGQGDKDGVHIKRKKR